MKNVEPIHRSTTRKSARSSRRKPATTSPTTERVRNVVGAQAAAPTEPRTGWLTAKQAGDYMGLCEEFVRELARRGLLRGYKIRGAGKGIREKWRFKPPDCDRYIESGARVA